MFESIVFRSRAYAAGFVDVEIWVEGNQLHYSKDVMIKGSVKDKVSAMTVEELSAKLEQLGILKWKRNYKPEGYFVLDGEYWIVRYKDSSRQRKKVIEGDNMYPENWEEFLTLLSDVVGDIEL